MIWPDHTLDGLATDAAISGTLAYGISPDSSGYRIADLHCAPGMDSGNVEGVYGEFGIGIVLSGAFEYVSEGSAEIAVPGSLLFANRNEAFTVRHLCAGGNRRIVLFLSNDLIEPLADNLNLKKPRFRSPSAPPSHLTPAVSGMLLRIARGDADSDEAAMAIARIALQCATSDPAEEQIPAADRRRILDVVDYINANFADPCTLDTLAAIAGMSRFHFARRFRAVTGETANRYVTNRRLSAAVARLTSTARPVSEIAYDVGFNDLSYFNARFKAAFGCPPSTWRRRN